MQIEFADKTLALVETDRAAETRLPISVINSFRKKLVVLRAAPDERTLRNWKSLHYEKLAGNLAGKRSIRINEKWRMVFDLDTECSPPKISVLSIEDYH